MNYIWWFILISCLWIIWLLVFKLYKNGKYYIYTYSTQKTTTMYMKYLLYFYFFTIKHYNFSQSIILSTHIIYIQIIWNLKREKAIVIFRILFQNIEKLLLIRTLTRIIVMNGTGWILVFKGLGMIGKVLMKCRPV